MNQNPNQKTITYNAKWDVIGSIILLIASQFTATIPLLIISIIEGGFALKKSDQLTKPYKILAWACIVISMILLILSFIQVFSIILQG